VITPEPQDDMAMVVCINHVPQDPSDLGADDPVSESWWRHGLDPSPKEFVGIDWVGESGELLGG
jgi:hypothetical protein